MLSLFTHRYKHFINDLAKDFKNLNLGVGIEPGVNVSIQLFADDIVLLGPTEEQLQLMLSFLSDWCHINKMEVNINKTKIIHFRKKCCERTHQARDQYRFISSKVNRLENPLTSI